LNSLSDSGDQPPTRHTAMSAQRVTKKARCDDGPDIDLEHVEGAAPGPATEGEAAGSDIVAAPAPSALAVVEAPAAGGGEPSKMMLELWQMRDESSGAALAPATEGEMTAREIVAAPGPSAPALVERRVAGGAKLLVNTSVADWLAQDGLLKTKKSFIAAVEDISTGELGFVFKLDADEWRKKLVEKKQADVLINTLLEDYIPAAARELGPEVAGKKWSQSTYVHSPALPRCRRSAPACVVGRVGRVGRVGACRRSP